MIDVSVIIPVYNAYNTIGRAIDSVLKQKMVEVEIICVDDGSNDGTVSRIGDYVTLYPEIHVLVQIHRGPGAARNKGIEAAKGRYIAFLDADDYLMDDMAFSKMIGRCVEYRVPVCGAIMNLEENGVVRRNGNFQRILEQSGKGALRYVDEQFDYDFTSFIYACELFADNSIRFQELFFYEDPPFLVRALYKAEKYTMIDTDYYCYQLPNRVRVMNVAQCEELAKGIRSNICFALTVGLNTLLKNSLYRLLYEYGDWIYRYISESDILRKEVNGIIGDLRDSGLNYSNIDRIFKRPYQYDYEAYLFTKIKKYDRFYIFGNGKISSTFRAFLGEYKEINSRLCSGVISKIESNDNNVMDLETYSKLEAKGLLIVAVSGIYVGGVVDSLKENGISDYEILDMAFLSSIQ